VLALRATISKKNFDKVGRISYLAIDMVHLSGFESRPAIYFTVIYETAWKLSTSASPNPSGKWVHEETPERSDPHLIFKRKRKI
jgi:hypothetical protein